MVKSRRRQLVLLAVLAVIGGLVWYWSVRAPSSGRTGAPGRGKADAPLALDEVPRIGLDRLAQMSTSGADAAGAGVDDDGDASSRGPILAAATPDPAAFTPPVPSEPTPPPMNVRFIGAVEVRAGVWVASLLTDRKDLLTGKEGDIIGNRYRIVKIGIESIDLLETASGRQRRVRLGGS
jgi:hypothetical protein